MPKIEVDHSLCKRDHACADICLLRLFVRGEKDSVPYVISEDLCISCGHCVAICPGGAIVHEDFPQGSIMPIHEELRPSVEQMTEILRTRRSIREFTDRPVEKHLIDRIIDCARFAPSGCNSQSTEFVVVQDRAVLNKIVELTSLSLAKTVKQLRNPILRRIGLLVAKDNVEQLLSSLPVFDRLVDRHKAGEDSILFGAPLLLVFHGKMTAPFPVVSASLALQNASLTAHALGLGDVYIGSIVAWGTRDSRIRRLLSIPKGHQIHGALALGYPRYEYKKWIDRRPARVKWILG